MMKASKAVFPMRNCAHQGPAKYDCYSSFENIVMGALNLMKLLLADRKFVKNYSDSVLFPKCVIGECLLSRRKH